MKKLTGGEFANSKEMGVNGYPTLVLKTPERLVSRGYQKAEVLIELINQKMGNTTL